ncbi:MAG: prephenate dehydratase [Casimicrobiaceae bacterium]|nr:prephenate dehydratase [Casimicrobiaceae bacterium]MDW8312390.1 prephenate dehydratase [Burkholderiales bacterium]
MPSNRDHPTEAEQELARLRQAIDALDDRLLELLTERATLARRIGHLKPPGAPLYRPDREAYILRRLSERDAAPLSRSAVVSIFREIISQCLALEQALTIAYLGPEGTYSHAAAVKHFGSAPRYEPCPTIDEAFRAVEAGHAHYAVVPVVNSTEGFVGRTLDLVIASPLRVCAEIELRIAHNLLTHEPTLATVDRVFAHSQSLGQTAGWLARHLPHAERVPVSSNGEAARLAAKTPRSAAIAGELAAQHHQVPILVRGIEDSPNNTTRFWVLGQEEVGPSGVDKTSLILSAPNRAGALVDLLEPLKRHGVSMTHLESRPSPDRLWEYYFFVDIEGHARDPRVAAALEDVRAQAAYLKVIGSYPRAVA